uniref:ID762 n=1 Tax=Bradyrhizobium japonicum TaxID=375 RepID=Q9AMX5_BRAJP|nr:ID762 [Bradyrhizobium japonicum]
MAGWSSKLKDRDGLKKVLLVHHVEGQCRCIIGFKDGDMRAAYMCGEPVYQKRGKKTSSWCADHYRKMHTAAEQSGVIDRSADFPRAISIVRTP